MASIGKEIGKAVKEQNGLKLLQDIRETQADDGYEEDDEQGEFPFEIEEKTG